MKCITRPKFLTILVYNTERSFKGKKIKYKDRNSFTWDLYLFSDCFIVCYKGSSYFSPHYIRLNNNSIENTNIFKCSYKSDKVLLKYIIKYKFDFFTDDIWGYLDDYVF